MINETVNNLTQAIRNQSTKDDDRTSGRGQSRVLAGLVRRHRAVLRAAEHRAAPARRPSISSPRTSTTSRTTGRRGLSEWLRQELQASYQFLEQAATPDPVGHRSTRPSILWRSSATRWPGETSPGSPSCR